jgi:membrane-associated phospholipid phosphatase
MGGLEIGTTMHRILRRFLFTMIFIIQSLLCPTIASAGASTVFKHVGNDIKYTFASWPMFVILGGGIAAGGFTQFDQDIANQFRDNPRLGKFNKVADIGGAPYVVDSAALLTWGAAKLAHDDKIAMTGEAMVEALALTEGSVLGWKVIFRRTRPDGGHYSFPSAHAARTFAVASVLETLHGPAAGIPAFLIAALISFSRIDQNSHYLSDVVFGAAWGAALGWGTARYHSKLFKEKLVITPSCAGNPGIGIAYLF